MKLLLSTLAVTTAFAASSSAFVHHRTQKNEAGHVGTDTYFKGPQVAPKCFYDQASKRTYVHYTSALHSSFKCHHVDGAGSPATLAAATHCKCTATHPQHHATGCMEFNHVSGKNHVIGGTCSAVSAAPTTTAAPLLEECVCPNGDRATGTQCTKPGFEQCISCNTDTHYLVGRDTENGIVSEQTCAPHDNAWSSWARYTTCASKGAYGLYYNEKDAIAACMNDVNCKAMYYRADKEQYKLCKDTAFRDTNNQNKYTRGFYKRLD
jgi:hypothetical protein